MLEHCSKCDKEIDTCGFYEEEDKFLLYCEVCNKSFCTVCAEKHIHFVHCEFCNYYHSAINIGWCAAVNKYENSSECSY